MNWVGRFFRARILLDGLCACNAYNLARKFIILLKQAVTLISGAAENSASGPYAQIANRKFNRALPGADAGPGFTGPRQAIDDFERDR